MPRLIPVGFPPPSSLYSSPPFLIHFSLVYLPTTLSLALLCLKRRDFKGQGRKQAQRFGDGHQKASEREPGRVFSSLSRHPFQNAGPLFSVTTTYLVPRIFFIPAPGSRILGSGSPSSKKTEEIISPVKWRGTKICFAGRSKEWPGVLTDPSEAEILLKWPKEKTILLLLLLYKIK